VWMLTAQGIESMMSGPITDMLYSLRSRGGTGRRTRWRIDREIAVQDHDVPGEDGGREVHHPTKGRMCQTRSGRPMSAMMKEDAHGNRRDGEKLAEQYDLLDGLEVIDVGRDHKQHRRAATPRER